MQTSDPAVTIPDNANSASTPADAARTASGNHFGSGDAASVRRPILVLTPMSAPIACTARTPPKARSALGVCSSVITEAASWITASSSAAISSGPPSADATTQRVTNHDEFGAVAAAVVFAVPHTIARTGSNGMTPSSRPPIETGT